MTAFVSTNVLTADPDVAAAAVYDVYPGMRIRIDRPSDDERPLLRQEVRGDGLLLHQRLGIGVPARAVGDVAGQFVVAVPRAGAVGIRTGGADLDTSRVFLTPLDRLDVRWEAFEIDTLSIDRAAIAAAAAVLTGGDTRPVRFLSSSPVSAAMEQYWLQVHRHVGGVLARPELVANALVSGEALRIAAHALLLTFPNSAMAAAAARPPSTVVDRAVAFIETQAGSDIGIGEIAAAAGAAPRPLTAAFRDRFGTTALQHLREVRFRRAQADLLAADPHAGDRVAAIAGRWGFVHAGRFAVDYRRRFGESPGSTLRR